MGYEAPTHMKCRREDCDNGVGDRMAQVGLQDRERGRMTLQRPWKYFTLRPAAAMEL